MLHKQLSLAVVAASALVTQVAGDCNPLTSSSCGSNDALSSTYSYDFSDGEDGSNWSSIGQGDPNYDSNGAHFVVKKKGDAPTIESSWYILFGRVEVHMKAAPGTGIVSSSVLLSDDLDEIDWEWLGGNPNAVQTNYFSKGDTTTTGREVDAGVANSQSTTHNYTIDWNKDACTWYIDGNAVRTLPYSDTYPQTPMRVKLGIWAGGDSDNAEGTIEWAGGKTDFGDAPFTMSVESIKVTNYNPAKSYSYGDRTGVYESIKVDGKGDDSSSSDSESSTTLKTKTKTKTASSTSGSSTTFCHFYP
ncbi:concanavalin A-like lectin/glucanase domain-containing protein [Mariannaea sp. PMI_226]|nr:concanavalin A-like lectin/glucanase domain-containing protein [Mariannaea sp. PMI_226]